MTKPTLPSASAPVVSHPQSIAASRLGEPHFREIFRKATIPFCVVHPETAALHFNTFFEKTFGYSSQDLPSFDAWWRLAFPDPVYRESVQATCNDAYRRSLTSNFDPEAFETRVACKDGSIRIMAIRGSTIEGDLLLTLL